MLTPAAEILTKLTDEYPLLMKHFKPEVRKIQDIAYREKKVMGVEPKLDEKQDKPTKPPRPPKITEKTFTKHFDIEKYHKVKEEIAVRILGIDATSL